ncbi:MAG: cyclic lactone autoinducer peptide [Oscillospiraceae bacterium]|nr:cyclic lactone autoinducer peptide [Oscillospiraceae bacterium]
MKKQRSSIKEKAVKAMASAAETVARNNVDGRCFIIMHKPKEPKNLAKRLETFKN